MKEDYSKLDTATLEAMARKHESRERLLGNRAPNSDEFKKAGSLRKEVEAALKQRADDLSKVVLNPEGTAPTLADANGNFAKTQVQANAGGIGINDSNSKSPEETAKEINDLNARLAKAEEELAAARAAAGAPGTNVTLQANPSAADPGATPAAAAAQKTATTTKTTVAATKQTS